MYAYGDNSRTENLTAWVREHIEYIFISLLVIFYLFVSNYFAWGPTFVSGGGVGVLPTSGGSDPYYNWMNIVYFITYHHWIVFDPRMNYPIGTINPRNPFFHMVVIVVAEAFGPLFGTNGVTNVAFYAFEELDAVFGAIMIIPVYLIGKELFGKKGGLVGAFLFSIMAVNLSAGVLSDGRMHTPELLFALFVVYFYIKAIKTTKPTYLVDKMNNFRSLGSNLLSFYRNNRVAVVYVMLAGASLGGLMLSWQGYAYIEAIILIYVAVQILANLVMKKPSGYLTFYTIIFVVIGFAMGAYYYQILGEGPQWYNTELILGVLVIGFAVLMNLIGRKPWIIIIPALALAVALAVIGIAHFYPALLVKVLGGYGYFIKSRVYSTIAEAEGVTISTLGSYINGYGAAEFILGLSGLGYVIYRFIKSRSDLMLFFAIFSIVSIFMSFESFKFNIDAAPVFAILSGGLLIYFLGIVRLQDMRKRRVSSEMSPVKSLKGNIKGLQVAFVIIAVLAIVVPSGLSAVSSGIPSNNAGQINAEVASAIPSFFGLNASTVGFAGGSGFAIVNASDPQVQSFLWLASQDKNISFESRPAYLSWWDYGFQEMYQGQHPTVADDFQQGYEMAGQTLLAQNQSQIVSLYIARVIQGNYVNNGNNFNSTVKSTLIQYLGNSEFNNVMGVSRNPGSYTSIVLSNPSLYGDFITQITSANVYFAYLNGQLSSKYSLNTLNNLYQKLISETGYNIAYTQITVGSSGLFPISASDPGIFYAPAFLTDYQSYDYQGEVVPYPFYNIIATTSNGTFPLNETPKDVTITGTNITYTSNFYNSSIYRFTIGYPPSAVGLSNGIPGVSTGNSSYPVMPAWNMSNFEIVYSSSYYNPYKDYANHLSAGKYIPLEQAYKLYKENNGTVVLFPPATDLVNVNNEWDPIVQYYPGAVVQGKVVSADGRAAPGVYVTLYDQYGIPHEVVKTNATGYYSLVAVPGNDTLAFSTGTYDSLELSGRSGIAAYSLNVSTSQAERTDTAINSTTGLPGYYFVKNLTLPQDSVVGNTHIVYTSLSSNSTTVPVSSGTLILKNSTYGNTINLTITNGVFNQLNVPPETYNASLLSNGSYYSNIGNVSVVANSTTNKNFTVKLDIISASVSIGSRSISSVPLNIETANGQVLKKTFSDASGVAQAWVMPGNYTVTAGNSMVTSSPAHISFNTWGSNDTQSFELSPAVHVVMISQRPGNTSIELLRNGNYLDNITMEKMSNGSFSATAPLGVYTVYAIDGNYSYLNTVTLNANSTFYIDNAQWGPTSTVQLTSHITGSKASYTGNFEIMNSTALISYPLSSNSTTIVKIPVGLYSFSAFSSASAGLMYGNVLNSVGPFTNLNISLVKSNYINATALNGRSSTNYTALPSGLAILYSSSGFPVSFENLTGGRASLLYPGISIGGMYVHYLSASYVSTDVVVKSRTLQFSVNPVTVTGMIRFDPGAVSPDGAKVSLYSSGANFTAEVQDGNVTFNFVNSGIPVGAYDIALSSLKNGFMVNNPIISVGGRSQSFARSLSDFGKVTVNGSTTTNIYYLNGTKVSSPNNLTPGYYYAYAYSSSKGVNISKIYVNGFMTISPTYLPYANLNLSNSQGVSSGEYLTIGSGFGIMLPSGVTPLPLGYYSVSYRGSVSNSTGTYLIKGATSLSLKSNADLSVPVTSSPVLATISGFLSFNGAPAGFTHIVFYSPDNTQTVTTNAEGEYSVSLMTVNYTVYSQDSSLGSAFFQRLKIQASGDSAYYNLSMQPAYKTKVYVIYTTGAVDNNVTVKSSFGGSYVFNSSQVSLLIPYGSYNFSTSYSSSIVSTNGSSVSVAYNSTVSVLIDSPQNVFLNLHMIPKPGFKITPEQAMPRVSPKQSFTYRFSVQNTGNVAEFIRLGTGSSNWNATFNTTTMNIKPGQILNVSGTFDEVGNVAYGNNSIPVNIAYSGTTISKNLPVFVNQLLAYSATKQNESLEGKDLVLPIVINNTGNIKISVNFSILDKSYITNRSWVPSLIVNNVSTDSYLIGYGSSITLNVVLAPNISNPPYNFDFTVEIFNKTVGYQNQTLSVTHPTSIQVGSHVSGNKIISDYTANPYEPLYIGLIVIAISVVAGFVLMIFRGRKR